MARLTVKGSGLSGMLALAAGVVVTGLALTGLATGLVIGGGGCKTAKEQAKTFKPCGSGSKCKSPNVCIRTDSGSRDKGICVYPCTRDDQCPQPFRCTGSYRLSGKSGHYCRRPSVSEGGDCSRIQDGCKAGHRCFKNRCVLECTKLSDCPNQTKRCLQVVDTTHAGKGAKGSKGAKSAQGTKNLFRGCLDAKQTHGQQCASAGPFCARDHICYRRKCLRTCADDKGCAKGFICDGAFYKGVDARKNQARGAKPDVRYCRRAGGDNAACDLSAGKTCARGLYCLSRRCRKIQRAAVGKPCHERRGIFCAPSASCFGGKCRLQCKVDQECPKVRRKAGRCQLRTVRKVKMGLCF